MSAITDTKKVFQDKFCVARTGACRPNVPTFGCRGDMLPTCWQLSQPRRMHCQAPVCLHHPWRVISVLSGVSYKLEHFEDAGCKENKHAADLSPYLLELIPFQPVDGADTRYRQLYKPITTHPFKEAGLKGFTPRQPFQVSTSNLAEMWTGSDFHWPSLYELNDEITPFPSFSDDKFGRYLANDSFTTLHVMATGPPPGAPDHAIPKIPAIHLLPAAIIHSVDHLFFVLHRIRLNKAREWCLVRVASEDSISLYHSCTQDGWFLFKFYICHPSDWR